MSIQYIITQYKKNNVSEMKYRRARKQNIIHNIQQFLSHFPSHKLSTNLSFNFQRSDSVNERYYVPLQPNYNNVLMPVLLLCKYIYAFSC